MPYPRLMIATLWKNEMVYYYFINFKNKFLTFLGQEPHDRSLSVSAKLSKHKINYLENELRIGSRSSDNVNSYA